MDLMHMADSQVQAGVIILSAAVVAAGVIAVGVPPRQGQRVFGPARLFYKSACVIAVVCLAAVAFWPLHPSGPQHVANVSARSSRRPSLAMTPGSSAGRHRLLPSLPRLRPSSAAQIMRAGRRTRRGRPAHNTTAPLTLAATTAAAPAIPLLGSSAAVLDATTGRWLILNHPDLPRPMASTTKMMTALVAIQAGHLDRPIVTTAEDVAVGQASGSAMGFGPNEHFSLRQLLYGLLLPSGNDAALAIARGVAGSVPAFVQRMNLTAAHLGLTDTHFANPDGLPDAGHYSSARDLVLLARAAMRLPLFRQIVATRATVIPAGAAHGAVALTNINWFLGWYPGADGVKPGYTGSAGLCQVLSAHRHGHWLIAAVMNTPNLYADARTLMDTGFAMSAAGQGVDPAQGVGVWGGTATDPLLRFPRTGQSIRAGFLRYYLAHGGGVVLGLPLTAERVEGGRIVQYFTRARLWWDPTQGVAHPDPLGLTAMQTLRAPGAGAHRVAPGDEALLIGRQPVTHPSIRGAILAAYRAWGGVSSLGVPVTDEIPIDRAGGVVQVFTYAALRWTTQDGVTVEPLGTWALQGSF